MTVTRLKQPPEGHPDAASSLDRAPRSATMLGHQARPPCSATRLRVRAPPLGLRFLAVLPLRRRWAGAFGAPRSGCAPCSPGVAHGGESSTDGGEPRAPSRSSRALGGRPRRLLGPWRPLRRPLRCAGPGTGASRGDRVPVRSLVCFQRGNSPQCSKVWLTVRLRTPWNALLTTNGCGISKRRWFLGLGPSLPQGSCQGAPLPKRKEAQERSRRARGRTFPQQMVSM